jgi:hypothetical protein
MNRINGNNPSRNNNNDARIDNGNNNNNNVNNAAGSNSILLKSDTTQEHIAIFERRATELGHTRVKHREVIQNGERLREAYSKPARASLLPGMNRNKGNGREEIRRHMAELDSRAQSFHQDVRVMDAWNSVLLALGRIPHLPPAGREAGMLALMGKMVAMNNEGRGFGKNAVMDAFRSAVQTYPGLISNPLLQAWRHSTGIDYGRCVPVVPEARRLRDIPVVPAARPSRNASEIAVPPSPGISAAAARVEPRNVLREAELEGQPGNAGLPPMIDPASELQDDLLLMEDIGEPPYALLDAEPPTGPGNAGNIPAGVGLR